jgi:hypothetical protein
MVKFGARVVWGLAKNWFVGGTFDLNHTIASDVNASMAADPYYVRYGPDNKNGGLGVAAQYDSRDVATNAWRGTYVGLTATFYDRRLGAEEEDRSFPDYRQYKTLGRMGEPSPGGSRPGWSRTKRPGRSCPCSARIRSPGVRRRPVPGARTLSGSRSTATCSCGQRPRASGFVAGSAGTLGRDRTHLTGLLPAAGVGFDSRSAAARQRAVRLRVGWASYGIYFNFTEAF